MPDSAPVSHLFVSFGATGDLAHRKLLPALYFLHKNGQLSPDGRIIAVARHPGATRFQGRADKHLPGARP